MVKRITSSAICLALSVIFLYGAAVLSTGKLAALGLASLLCGICVSMHGVRYGVALYVGTSLLALLLLPNKMFALFYVLFAGYYPIVKLYIEKLNKLPAEWILKFLFFNLTLSLIYIVAKIFFLPALESVLASIVLHYLGLVLIALQIIFAIYDWMLSYMIGYYHQFLRRIRHD